jgi:hypothetical protein
MSDDLNNFNDPALKAAIRRAIPAVSAPQSLRNAVADILRSADDDTLHEPLRLVPELKPSAVSPWLEWLSQGRKLAIAASILGLGLGVGLFLALENQAGTQNQTTIANAGNMPIAPSTLVDVAHREVQQGLSTGHNMLAPYDQVSRELRQQTGPAALNVDLSSMGWSLVGARKLSLPNSLAVQLFYQHGQQSLSVFVLPNSAGRSQTPIASLGNHSVAARQYDGATLCVIADGFSPKTEAQEINKVADYLISH